MPGRLVGLMRSKGWRYLALEALVVIFGVLIALLVDRWREEAARRDDADAAVIRVLREAQQNLDAMRLLDAVVRDRLAQLRAAAADAPEDAGLADLMGEFHGYRSPDLSGAAWHRLAASELADIVDPEWLAEAFYLYEWNQDFAQLDGEVSRLIYSELFYLPEHRATAVAISERLMAQQLTWARQAIPQYERFLKDAEPDE